MGKGKPYNLDMIYLLTQASRKREFEMQDISFSLTKNINERARYKTKKA